MFWNLNDDIKILPTDSNSEILRFWTDKGQKEQKVASGPAEQLAENRFPQEDYVDNPALRIITL